MTLDNYNLLVPFRDVCAMFANEGIYVGGADGLIHVYETMYQTTINRSCSNCIGDMLMVVHLAIRKHEKENAKS